MSRPRKKAQPAHEEHHVDERWLVSYSDMITVLFCLFIVLFAMSSVDVDKYDKLKSSLATGFGTSKTDKIDVSEGIIVPPDQIGKTSELLTDMQAAAAEVDDLSAVQDQANAALKAKGLGASVRFGMDQKGLTIRMVSSEAFFGPDSANLKDQAIRVLDTIAPAVKASHRSVSVEGHTAKQPGHAYLRDWELSSERSVNVVRRLTEVGGVNPAGVSSTGFGDNKPLVPGTSEAAMEKNRRVDIVVLSAASEKVRSLIPKAVADKAAGKTAEKPAEDHSTSSH